MPKNRQISVRCRRGLLLLLLAALPVLGAWAETDFLTQRPPGTPPDVDMKYGRTCVSAGCHAIDDSTRIPMHLPYLEGECLSCHYDHRSEEAMLLRPGGDLVCLQCHTEVEMVNDDMLHPPSDQTCAGCHDPHQSRVRNLLREEDMLLGCAECHADFLVEAKELPYHHDFFEPKEECGSCHFAHKRADEKYMRENVAESCLTCHDMPIQSDGRKLENVGMQIQNAKFVHEALDEKSCPACHTPHGSVQPALLLSGYPAGNYEGYSTENYQLCWQCHDPGLAESVSGVGFTEFRDGELNLHRVHVVELKRGRACHICHTAHAGEVPHLLKEELQFGTWTTPLDWKEIDGGGYCATPCHRPLEYVRTSVGEAP